MNTSKIPPKLSEIQGLIYKKIQEKEGIRQGDIARILEIPYSTVNRQVKKMAKTGILRLERHGLSIKCYVI